MLMFTLISVVLTLSAPTEETLPHALYLSVVQIDHRDPGKEAGVLVKVFADDLQDAVRAAYPSWYVPTAIENFCVLNENLIGRYFNAKLTCAINGGPTTLNFIGGTKENDVFWLKFSMKTPAQWRSLSVQAPYFMEIFPSQSNVIQVNHLAEKRFGRLTKKEQSVVFQF